MVERTDMSHNGVLNQAVQEYLASGFRGEEPDLDEFVKQYPGLEEQIKQRVQECQRVSSLFDSLRQTDESEFQDAGRAAELVGKQFGGFKITEVIGRGGMGVVYKAHDSRLNRVVAVKAMPSHLLEDAAAQTRFRREAQLLASLNHANIGAIHDIIEQAEGVGYLILEYVPGETLAERIARGALKVEDALAVGLQIAEAVAAAHEKGVVHRDLKPGNIKTTPEGKVKVLDFGLAKVSTTEGKSGEITETQPGRVIGTPAYMSPEQARGDAVDHRSDIWSFGCVLYEMLTGHLPFQGETATDTLARIIEREPDWDLLPQITPANIRVLLRRCLAKDARRRLQHMGDVVIEIEETLSLPADAPPISVPAVGKRRRTLWLLAVTCSVAVIAVGLIAASIFLSKPTVATVPTLRTVIRLPENQRLAISRPNPLGVPTMPAVALSPDGSRLVYVADVGDTTQLFLRLMDEFEPKPIAGTERAFSPVFSPDGQSVCFFTKDKLKKISLLGGEPMVICDARNPVGVSWGADGMIYFDENEGKRLCRVPAAGGIKERLGFEVELAEEGIIACHDPQPLPGGKAVLISLPLPQAGTLLLSLETREKKIVVKDGKRARYVPTGHLVYTLAGAVQGAPFDLTTLDVTGDSVPILDGVMLDSWYGTAQFAFSNDGLLVYVPGTDMAKSIPVWVDRQGNVEPLAMSAQIYGTFDLSPDGKRLAAETQSNVYIYDIGSGKGTRLTLEDRNYSPIWTPDGKRVTFGRAGEGQRKRSIFWKPVDGIGNAELLHSSQDRSVPYSWSPNGKQLTFSSGGDIWVLPLEGDRKPELIVGTEFSEWGPVFSPDGRWIAYTSDKDGKYQVYVQPYPGMDRIWQISDDFGEEPIWSPKGDELFYRNGDKWMVVSISTEPEFSAGTPQLLFEGPYNNVPGLSYDVSPDGQRFLVLQPEYDDSEVRELHVVTNWFEELKRLVPSPEAR